MNRRLTALLAVLLLAGCGGTVPPAEEAPLSPVYTDWSHLTPYVPAQEIPADQWSPEALPPAFEPYSGDGPLLPREDYGTLLPYVGKEASLENYITDRLPLYGLATADGRLVTEPVYAGISCLSGFLLLERGTGDLYRREESLQERGDFAMTVAAPDGRWVRDAGDCYYVAFLTNAGSRLLVLGGAGGALTLLDSGGETAAVIPAEAFQPYFDPPLRWNNEGGPWLEWKDGLGYITAYSFKGQSSEADDFLRLYLDLDSRQVLREPPPGFPAEPDYDHTDSATPVFPGYRYLSPEPDPITGKTYYFGHLEAGGCDLLDWEGNVLLSDYDDWYIGFPQILDGKAAVWEGHSDRQSPQFFSWYDLETGDCAFRYPIRSSGG